jgi:hypothetical protein
MQELYPKVTDLLEHQEVIDMITALPTVDDLTLTDKPAVESARSKYDDLKSDQIPLVTNSHKLTQLEDKIIELESTAEIR